MIFCPGPSTRASSPRALVERSVQLAAATKGFGARALRAALDSSPLWGAGRVEDTFNLMGHALRKALGVIAALQGRGQAAGIPVVAEQAGVPQLAASSLKAALDLDWDDPAARDAALVQVLGLLDQVGAFVAAQPGGQAAAAAAVATAVQVRDQDADCSGPVPSLRRGVARDRRISVEDGDMRHGRKSRSVLIDGYKRHVLRDLDTGLIPAVGSRPPMCPMRQSPATSRRTCRPPGDSWPSCTSPGHTCPRPWSATAARTWPSSARPGGSATPAAGSPRTSSPLTSPPGS